MIVISTISAGLVILFARFKMSLKDFSFKYTTDKIDDSKVVVSFDSTKTYKIERYDYFPDRENKYSPNLQEAILTDKEYKTIKNLLLRCNMFKMKDIYGMRPDARENADNVKYQISFTTKGKNKLISIANLDSHKFSPSFLKLMQHMDSFIENHPL